MVNNRASLLNTTTLSMEINLGLHKLSSLNSLETKRLKDKGATGLHDMSYKPNIEPSDEAITREILYSSKLGILFCDLSLNPSEIKTCSFKVKLPIDMPSTFRGKLYYKP